MTDLEKAFQILEVAPDSSETVIKKAWRALVRSYHPDMAKSDPKAANQRLAEINAAFDAVSSCSPNDIRQLQQAAARKARAHKRMKREQEARHRCANEATPRKSNMPVVRRFDAQKTIIVANQTNSARAGHGRTVSSDLSYLAQEAFAAAQAICAPRLAQTRSSIYL